MTAPLHDDGTPATFPPELPTLPRLADPSQGETLPPANAWPATLAPTAGGSPGTIAMIHGYEILGELGRGGMGIVYKARQTKADRVVAIKMILGRRQASLQEQIRFQIETEAVARLQHPNIVPLHEVGEVDGMPFFSLEFCEGGSLDQRLRQESLPADKPASISNEV